MSSGGYASGSAQRNMYQCRNRDPKKHEHA